MAETVQDRFPVPSPFKLHSSFWPGISAGSTEALRSILKDNHERWHVFFNDHGFHNHSSHFAIALWALGAHEETMQAAYKLDCAYQLPAFKSPEPITVENFVEHLGDHKFYNAYLEFFADVVQKKGFSGVLEECVFAPKMNFDDTLGVDKKQPEMLNRFLDGLTHPMIHAGYGTEFGLPGMIIEGLSSAAVHSGQSTTVLPRSFFEAKEAQPKKVHALDIVSRILKDPRFAAKEKVLDKDMYSFTMEKHGQILAKYASEWSVNISDPEEVERKIEELVWTNCIIYGIGGWMQGEDFNADFFYMHLVTSSIFLSSIAAYLSPPSQELFLRAYFVVSLGWWVGHGRVGFDIPGFFAAHTDYLTPPGSHPTPHDKSLPSKDSPIAMNPNPWFSIIQNTLVHPDDHLPKTQRALAYHASLYGNRPAGFLAGTELAGADKLDGSLFLRVAGLTAKRLGRMRDGEEPAPFWDMHGFPISD